VYKIYYKTSNHFIFSLLARAAQALYEVGPAVLHGGFSTFLAFVLLAASASYVFLTFFKVIYFTLFLIILKFNNLYNFLAISITNNIQYSYQLLTILVFFIVQVFFLVVVFGIFHGIVFLPVILSLVGPAPYADHSKVHAAVEARENHNNSHTRQQQPKVKPLESEMTIVVDGKSVSNRYFHI